jgi:hypothetical protein
MKKLPIGTRVFDVLYGWGEVIEYKEGLYTPLTIRFKNGDIDLYTKEGKVTQRSITPILSLTEYTLTEGGFTPIAYFDKPSIGCMGYFWDNTRQGYVSYSRLVDIDSSGIYTAEGGTRWQEFAKEIPQWFLDKMNNLCTEKN